MQQHCAEEAQLGRSVLPQKCPQLSSVQLGRVVHDFGNFPDMVPVTEGKKKRTN